MRLTTDRQREYESWVNQWHAPLYRFAYRLCGQADTAEDLVQETFYHAWQSMDKLRDRSKARAWLFQILRHRYSHHVRTDTRRPKLSAPLDAVAERADAEAFTPLEDMARSESLQLALDALDARYRMPLLLVFMEGMTCREAAEELDLPLGTVLSRIHRARRFLRETMGESADADKSAKAEKDQPKLRLGG